MTDKTDILLSRYFSGEADEKELRDLDNWLAESAENEAYFDQMTMLYQHSSFVPPMENTDVDGALADFKAYIAKSKAAGKRSFRKHPAFRMIAASVILLLGIFTFYTLHKPIKTIQLAAVDSAEEYILFENAEVVLEPGSTINYFSDKDNELVLRGRAAFKVASAHEKKLLVQAGETFIQDIGTEFTVTAYDPHESVIVEVFEGQVLFFTGTNEGIIINPSETAVYNPETKQFSYIHSEETPEEIVFKAVPLIKAAATLARRYGVDIEIKSPVLEEMQISASFDKNETIDTIMEIVAETLSLHVVKNGNTFIVE